MQCTVFKKFGIFLSCIILFSCISAPHTTQIEVEKNSEQTLAEKQEIEEQDIYEPGYTDFFESIAFGEVWTYIHNGQEQYLKNDIPVTDIGYFGAQINYRGALSAVPDARKLSFFPARMHLVVTCNHYGMTHIVLSPDYPLRRAFIADLIQEAYDKKYDGIQIDFEMVLADDEENFLSFLSDLKHALKAKKRSTGKRMVLSAALPARTKKLSRDAYDYAKITALVDRVFVMAYDEHWSRGVPGPVASFGWCQNIAEYALASVGTEKLIMGQPFYGRTWGNVNPNKAFFYSGIQRQLQEFEITGIERTEGVSRFSYTVPLTVTGYFDDAKSIAERSKLYKDMGVVSTGFWCLGQEDPAVWDYISIKKE